MNVQAPAVFLRCYFGLTDPRRHNVRHLFTDLLAMAILAVMCRSDDWNEVVLYGIANREWLGTFLELPNGIPCEDTFSRLFARINPDAFEKCFIEWTRSLASSSDGRLVAIDGKTLRHSFKHGWNKQMIHLVSDWCGQNESRRAGTGATGRRWKIQRNHRHPQTAGTAGPQKGRGDD